VSRFDSEVGYQINNLMRKLLEDFIKDIRIESVKFRLQTSVPHKEIQHNDIIGNFEYNGQDGATVAETLGKQLKKIENLVTAHDPVPLLTTMVKEWNDTRRTIQYQGYYGSNERRSEAYCYVFLLRILKRKHKVLYKKIKNRLTIGYS
jgi:hypothetical protein